MSYNNNGLNDKFILVDVGAYRVKSMIWGEEIKPIELKSVGFKRGYVDDAEGLLECLKGLFEEILKVYDKGVRGVPVVFTVSFKDMKFLKESIEISCSPKVSKNHIGKIAKGLESKVLNKEDGEIIFSRIVRYEINSPDGTKREVSNPIGLNAKTITADAVFALVPRGVYDDLMDVIRRLKGIFGFGKIHIYDSSIVMSYGISSLENLENFINMDIGHTSIRIVEMREGEIEDYRHISGGGISLINRLSNLGIQPTDMEKVLYEIFIKGRHPTVSVGKTSINSTMVVESIREYFRETLSNIFMGNLMSTTFCGGFLNLGESFKDLLETALHRDIHLPSKDGLIYTLNGVRSFMKKAYYKEKTSFKSSGESIFSRIGFAIMDFINKEILGKED